MSCFRYIVFALQLTPTVIIAEPQQPAVLIGHLARNADLIAMEIVGFLFAFKLFIGVVVNLRQRFVAVRIGVNVGVTPVGIHFLQQMAAVPNKSGFISLQAVCKLQAYKN
ncbi:Uncharacterised protein [Neisseria animaloris]|nr:Uncharacterised protein [Neisseria animaloris]